MQSSIGSLIASKRRRLERAGEPSAPSRRLLSGTGPQLHAARVDAGTIEGWAFDPVRPAQPLVVELLIDDEPTTLQRATRFEPVLAEAGLSDPCHGFRFALDPAALVHARHVGVRLANIAEGPIRLITLADAPVPAARPVAARVEWLGGLRFAGWVRPDAPGTPAPLVEAFLDGERIARTRADGSVEIPGAGQQAGFRLALPRAFADGTVRRIEFRQNGHAMPGGPVAMIAFPDGLEALAPRGANPPAALFDRAFPDAVPFAAFETWDARFLPPPTAPRLGKPVALALVGEEAAAETTLASPGFETDNNWVAGILAPDGAPTRFLGSDLVRFLEEAGADCPFVLFLASGTRVRPGAQARLVAALEADPAAEIAYGDFLIETGERMAVPLLLPAFDAERFLEQGLPALAFAMRRAPALKAARRGVSELFRLFLSPLEQVGGAPRGAHLHVPGPGFVLEQGALAELTPTLIEAGTAHLAARGIEAVLTPRADATLPAARVRRRQPARRAITIILDATQGEARLDACLDALEPARVALRADVLVVARDCDEARRRSFLLDGVTLLDAMPAEGFASRLGRAADGTETDLLCFLDADLAPDMPDWLDEMAGRLCEAGTGAVGPVIASPAGAIVEAGRVLRADGGTVPAFADRMGGDAGYGDALTVARQVSVLGRRCLLTSRADFLGVGGFDPQLFPTHGGDVDFCLKLLALGRRLVVTPDARLTLSRASEAAESAENTRLRERAERLLFARWPDVFAADPFYSPLLDRGPLPYAGLAWPPGLARPRRAGVAPARNVPPGW